MSTWGEAIDLYGPHDNDLLSSIESGDETSDTTVVAGGVFTVYKEVTAAQMASMGYVPIAVTGVMWSSTRVPSSMVYVGGGIYTNGFEPPVCIRADYRNVGSSSSIVPKGMLKMLVTWARGSFAPVS